MGNHRSDETSNPGRSLNKNPSSAPAASPRAEIDRFLDQVRELGPIVNTGRRGRLIFALDATMSRQPTWDQASKLQAEMFREGAAVGGLDIQLVYYRGLAECRASSWIADPDCLAAVMSRIDCRGGHTQLPRCLLTPGVKTRAARLPYWSLLAMRWRNRSMSYAPAPESLAYST